MRINNIREFYEKIALNIKKKLPSKGRSVDNISNQQPLREQISIKNQIKFKLIIAFCIPVVLIISSGIFTYLKAKNAAIENYEISTLGNIQNSALYCDLLMTDIETKHHKYLVIMTLLFIITVFLVTVLLIRTPFITMLKATGYRYR